MRPLAAPMLLAAASVTAAATLGGCGGSSSSSTSTAAGATPAPATASSAAPGGSGTPSPTAAASASPAALTVAAACHILIPASTALTDKLLAAPAGEQRHKVGLTFSDLMKKTAARVQDKTFKARAAQLVDVYEHSVGSLPSPDWTDSCFAVGVIK